jgi:vesicle-fusing ATPase
MKLAGGLNSEAVEWIEDLSEGGLAAATDYYSGAELAGLVRSAASFALSRTFDSDDKNELGVVTRKDLEASLQEVRAALGKQDELLQLRCPFGVSLCSDSTERVSRDLKRFTIPMVELRPQIQSLLLVGGGGKGGAGVTALAAWAAIEASNNGITDYVRFITALDVLSDSEGGDDASRAAALVSKFEEAKTMPHSLLVLDDVDQLCAGQGACGYSSIMVATLRALLRTPPAGRVTRDEKETKATMILARQNRYISLVRLHARMQHVLFSMNFLTKQSVS